MAHSPLMAAGISPSNSGRPAPLPFYLTPARASPRGSAPRQPARAPFPRSQRRRHVLPLRPPPFTVAPPPRPISGQAEAAHGFPTPARSRSASSPTFPDHRSPTPSTPVRRRPPSTPAGAPPCAMYWGEYAHMSTSTWRFHLRGPPSLPRAQAAGATVRSTAELPCAMLCSVLPDSLIL
uniref:Uncharacterized protein n=1 Tax=Arundo donax TaxID=35708 RepID=A0A0A9BCS6_ARUDO